MAVADGAVQIVAQLSVKAIERPGFIKVQPIGPNGIIKVVQIAVENFFKKILWIFPRLFLFQILLKKSQAAILCDNQLPNV